MAIKKPASAYAPGSIKYNPEWPENPAIAQRTTFQDDDFTNCTAWLRVTPGGSGFVIHLQVQDWPDAPAPLTILVSDQQPADVPETPTPTPAPATP
jgi:hypothetical protein